MRKISLLMFFSILIIMTEAQVVSISFQERIKNSDAIIEGEVIDQKCYRETSSQTIYTESRISIYKTFAGLPETVSEVKLITPGGSIDDEIQLFSSNIEINKGNIGVFFLKKLNSEIQKLSDTENSFAPYSGPQGFIKYDQNCKTASDLFSKYFIIEKDIYQFIQQQTKNLFVEISKISLPTKKNKQNTNTVNIETISPMELNAGTGEILTITGSGFDSIQNGTQIWFTFADNPYSIFNSNGFKIINWSDTLIKIVVPDKAATGSIYMYRDGVQLAQSPQSLTIRFAVMNIFNNKINLCNKDNAGGITFNMTNDFNNNIDARNRLIESIDFWKCNTLINLKTGDNIDKFSFGDGINTIRWEENNELPDGVLGQTRSSIQSCSNGNIQRETDIVYSRKAKWNFGFQNPQADQIDFKSVILHELGHVHLLGHVNDPDDLMYFGIGNGEYKHNLNTNNLNCSAYIMDYSSKESVCGYQPMIKDNAALSNFDISLSSYPAEGGTTTISGNNQGCSANMVTAISNKGFSFSNWTENGVVVSTSNNYTFTVMKSRTLIANFVQNTSVHIVKDYGINVYSTNKNAIIENASDWEVRVIDISGRTILKRNLNTDKYEIGIPNPGLYLIRLSNKDNICCDKIVIY